MDQFSIIVKNIRQKIGTFVQILEIINNNLKPTLVQKFLIIQVHNALALPHYFILKRNLDP